MKSSHHKARHGHKYTFFAGGKLAISGSIFLTTTFMCIIYFSTPYGTSRNVISNFSYQPIQVDKVVAEEEDDRSEAPRRSLSDPMYTLGPKINDWDLKRAKWVLLNPAFPSSFSSSKPRVLLVTGSSPKPCANPIGDHYQVKAIKNKIDYCRIHGIDIFYNTALLDAEMTGFWAKLPLLRALLLSHPEEKREPLPIGPMYSRPIFN